MRFAAAVWCIAGSLLMSAPVHAEPASAAIASIAVEAEAGSVRLSGHALGLAEGHVAARMTITKSGPSGRMSTTQGGEFDLSKGKDAVVATVSLSMAAGDRLDVDLVLTDGQREVSRSKLSVGS